VLRRLAVPAALLAAGACATAGGGAQARPEYIDPLPADCTADAGAPDCGPRMEEAQLQRYPMWVQRQEGTLTLQLRGGTPIAFADVAAGTATTPAVRYFFRDYLPTLGYFLLEVRPERGSRGFLLVSASSGRQYPVEAVPVVSPDGTRFAVAVAAEAGDARNAVEIWRAGAEGLVHEWSSAPPAQGPGAWSPVEPVWLNRSALRFTRRTQDAAETTLRETQSIVRLTPTGWQVDAGR
jgi:hypothetical protein